MIARNLGLQTRQNPLVIVLGPTDRFERRIEIQCLALHPNLIKKIHWFDSVLQELSNRAIISCLIELKTQAFIEKELQVNFFQKKLIWD